MFTEHTSGSTLLHVAAMVGNYAAVKHLLDVYRADSNAQNGDGIFKYVSRVLMVFVCRGDAASCCSEEWSRPCIMGADKPWGGHTAK